VKRFFKYVFGFYFILSFSAWGGIDLKETLSQAEPGEWVRMKNPGRVESVTVVTSKNSSILTFEVHTYRNKKPQSWVEQVYHLKQKRIVQARIKYPDGSIDEIAPTQFEPFFEALENKDYKLVGSEEVKVPAGTFQADHYRAIVDDNLVHVWLSESVPITGLVKSKFKGGSSLLVSFGNEGVLAVFE